MTGGGGEGTSLLGVSFSKDLIGGTGISDVTDNPSTSVFSIVTLPELSCDFEMEVTAIDAAMTSVLSTGCLLRSEVVTATTSSSTTTCNSSSVTSGVEGGVTNSSVSCRFTLSFFEILIDPVTAD